eukprot:gene21681-27722_t
MSFGSVISATDPVTTIAIFDHLQVEPALYVIVVGVSILDDAVSIIMFNLFNSFLVDGNETKHSVAFYFATSTVQFLTIFAGSVAVGCAVGLFFAALFKQCKGILANSVQFHMLTLCAVYISYLAADSMRLSGITTVMFAGIAMQRYLKMFAEEQCVAAVTHAVSLAAQLFETVVFFMIGYSLLQNTSSSGSDGVFVLWSLLLTLVSRAAQIYPLAFFLNAYNKPLTVSSNESGNSEAQTLSWGYQHVTMVAGLRGPISYATSKLFPDTFGHNNLVAVASSVIILATIVVLGPLTVPVLRAFKVPFRAQSDADTEKCDTSSESSLSVEMSDLSQHSVEDGAFHQQITASQRRSDRDTNSYSALEKTGSERTERSWSGVLCSIVHCTAVVQWVERMERKYVVEYFARSDPFDPVAESAEDQNALNACKHCEAVSRSRQSVNRNAPSSEYTVVNSTDNALIVDAASDEFATGDVIYSHFSHLADKSKGSASNGPTIAVKSVDSVSSQKSPSAMITADESDRHSKRRREQEEDLHRILSIVREGIDMNLNMKEMV